MQKIKNLGPGLLYAAAAIGVSHLVQSTRAGAEFGYQLIWIILLANLIKYPVFKVGPLYTMATGKTLLEGYQNIGKPIMVLFYLATLATMFTVQAAVTIVSGGLAINLLGLDISIALTSTILLILSAIILFVGKYNILDNLIKVIIAVLSVSTIASVIVGQFVDFPKPDMALEFSWKNNGHMLFLIALIGWMPAPLDVPIWQSMWTSEKKKSNQVTFKDAIFDFNFGYIATAVLAVGFLILGETVMYRSGNSFSPQATIFAGELISLYKAVIGDWSGPIIAIAAFTTMFSTTLTCLDAFPRILAEADRICFKRKNSYSIWLFITVIGASGILFFYLDGMRPLVDLATTLSFVIAPIYAILNYIVLYKLDVPKKYQGGAAQKVLFQISILSLTIFALYYLISA